MKDFKKILVPVDGSKLSNLAFEHATSLARMVNGEVMVIHVIDPKSFGRIPYELSDIDNSKEVIENVRQHQLEVMLEDLVQQGKKSGVKTASKFLKGNIANEIIKESSSYDLIIMGHLGQNALSKLLMGSIAEKVSRHAKCSVMIVKEMGKN